jgi:hypothetical protein
MKKRLFLWIAVFLVALSACGPHENFNSRFVYEPHSPVFNQVIVEVSGFLDPANNLSEQTDVALNIFSNQGVRSVLQLEGRMGDLYLTGSVPGTDFRKGDRLDADVLRQLMIALGVVTAGQFKPVDAQELYSLVSSMAANPGAEPPEPVRYRLMESNVSYDYR